MIHLEKGKNIYYYWPIKLFRWIFRNGILNYVENNYDKLVYYMKLEVKPPRKTPFPIDSGSSRSSMSVVDKIVVDFNNIM